MQRRRKKVLTVQLPCAAVTPDMAEKVRQCADDNETSQSDIIRTALRAFFAINNSETINNLIVQENRCVDRTGLRQPDTRIAKAARG